jgi:hypothetical protein
MIQPCLCFPAGRARLLASSLLAPLLALALGCSGSTEPNRPAPTLSVTKANMVFPETPPAPPAPPVIMTSSSSVTVSGTFVTATPCYSLSASDRIDGRTLIIRLVATTPSLPCMSGLGFFQYTVTSLNVPASVTHLRLEQTGAISSWPAVLADEDIHGVVVAY